MKSIFKEIIQVIKWRSRNLVIDPFYILYWDIIPRLKRQEHSEDTYRRNSESKIAITLTTYKRPQYFAKTIDSFVRLNSSILDQFIIIVLVQGEHTDKETEDIIKKYRNHISQVIYPHKNLGCAPGYTGLIEEVIKLNVPYVINLQDDFLSTESISKYISELIDVIENDNKIGCIRLRSTKDKVNHYNIISRRKITYKKRVGNIAIGNAHFTFNPTIARLSTIKHIIPTVSERDAMQKYQKMGLRTGQLLADCFSHIGHDRVINWLK